MWISDVRISEKEDFDKFKVGNTMISYSTYLDKLV